MANNQTSFPQRSVPFVTPDGKITSSWFLFLVGLWTRTGSGSPPTPIANGTYTISSKLTPTGNPGSITTVNGVITAITTAS